MRAGRRVAAVAALWAGAGLGGAALAQATGPAEYPPASFAGTQYVDSAGCAFVRAGVGGAATYVPRLSASREPLCGLSPTFRDGAPVASAPVGDVPALREASEPAADAPLATAAAPAPSATATPRAPSARTTAAARPRAAAPVLVAQGVPAPVAAAPSAPLRLTLAEACAGRSGVQPGLRDARTGRAVDCGAPGPPATSAEARVADAGLATRAAASPGTAPLPSMGPGIPASNPIGLVPQEIAPLGGYERVWEDGRVNPGRGVPQPVSGAAILGARVVAPGVVAVPVPVAPGVPYVTATGVPLVVSPTARGLYVQVGAYDEDGHARRAIATLASLGLPVAVARSGGGQAVAAGPFATVAEAEAARAEARAAGYADAFIR